LKRHTKKYNLDDFLEVANEEDIPETTEDEPKGPNRADIIRNDEDDELEQPGADPDADEDLDEDDYGTFLSPLLPSYIPFVLRGVLICRRGLL
jgi:hypothetical protein